MNKLPCKDCICLAVCRLYYLQEIEKSEGNINQGYVSVRLKCSLLNNYFNQTESYISDYRAFISYIEEGIVYESPLQTMSKVTYM